MTNSNTHKELFLKDEHALVNLGEKLAKFLQAPSTVHLFGELGAGKTTMVRGFIHAKGHLGAVKSPTFTLVEPYTLNGTIVNHFDLYRLSDPEELEYLGIRDYFDQDAICFVEWADRARDTLQKPDLEIHIALKGTGREVAIQANTVKGEEVLSHLG
jgi:tRNA threonylcarbamoyladenosine biosynthesis protein TsaE